MAVGRNQLPRASSVVQRVGEGALWWRSAWPASFCLATAASMESRLWPRTEPRPPQCHRRSWKEPCSHRRVSVSAAGADDSGPSCRGRCCYGTRFLLRWTHRYLQASIIPRKAFDSTAFGFGLPVVTVAKACALRGTTLTQATFQFMLNVKKG